MGRGGGPSLGPDYRQGSGCLVVGREYPNAAAAAVTGSPSTVTRRTISYLTCAASRASKNSSARNAGSVTYRGAGSAPRLARRQGPQLADQIRHSQQALDGERAAAVAASGTSSVFAGFRSPREVISVAVRWYLRYGLSYRDIEELLAERGVTVVCHHLTGGCSGSPRSSSRPPGRAAAPR